MKGFLSTEIRTLIKDKLKSNIVIVIIFAWTVSVPEKTSGLVMILELLFVVSSTSRCNAAIHCRESCTPSTALAASCSAASSRLRTSSKQSHCVEVRRPSASHAALSVRVMLSSMALSNEATCVFEDTPLVTVLDFEHELKKMSRWMW